MKVCVFARVLMLCSTACTWWSMCWGYVWIRGATGGVLSMCCLRLCSCSPPSAWLWACLWSTWSAFTSCWSSGSGTTPTSSRWSYDKELSISFTLLPSVFVSFRSTLPASGGGWRKPAWCIPWSLWSCWFSRWLVTRFFGDLNGGDSEHWGDLGTALFTLFRLLVVRWAIILTFYDIWQVRVSRVGYRIGLND